MKKIIALSSFLFLLNITNSSHAACYKEVVEQITELQKSIDSRPDVKPLSYANHHCCYGGSGTNCKEPEKNATVLVQADNYQCYWVSIGKTCDDIQIKQDTAKNQSTYHKFF